MIVIIQERLANTSVGIDLQEIDIVSWIDLRHHDNPIKEC